MSNIQPVTSQQCPSLTATQAATLNAFYRSAPVRADDWLLSFQCNHRSPFTARPDQSTTVIELSVRQTAAECQMTLELTSGPPDFSWCDYDDEVRTLAWCVIHQGLLNCLQSIVDGNLTVLDVRAHSTAMACTTDSDSLPVQFRIENEHGEACWTGRLWVDDTLIRPDVFKLRTDVTEAWLSLPIPVVVSIDDMEISDRELETIEPGGFIRLDHNPGLVLVQLTLDCAHLRFTASTSGSNITVTSCL